MKIRHLRQPRRSYVCGQACLAMVLGLPDIESACKIVGHSRKMRTKEIVDALGDLAGSRKLGRARPDGSDLPSFCLLRTRWGVTICGHISVHADGQVYEPLLHGPVSLEAWLSWIRGNGGRLTSHLALSEPAEELKLCTG